MEPTGSSFETYVPRGTSALVLSVLAAALGFDAIAVIAAVGITELFFSGLLQFFLAPIAGGYPRGA